MYRILVVKCAKGDTPTSSTIWTGTSGNKMIDTINSERYTRKQLLSARKQLGQPEPVTAPLDTIPYFRGPISICSMLGQYHAQEHHSYLWHDNMISVAQWWQCCCWNHKIPFSVKLAYWSRNLGTVALRSTWMSVADGLASVIQSIKVLIAGLWPMLALPGQVPGPGGEHPTSSMV